MSTFNILHSGEHDEQWLEKRRVSGIGASESAVILGLSPWSSPFELYGQKIGLIDATEQTEAMKWGLILEGPILKEFAKETGREVWPWGELLQSKEHPFLIATPDGRQAAKNRDSLGVVQVKTSAYRAADWENGVPPHVYCQMQHEMAVTGHTWATAVVLLRGSKLLWSDVERDDKFINETLIPAVNDFWKRVVAQEPPPEVDGSEATKKALAAIYPQDNQETIELDGHFLDLHFERGQLAEHKRNVETSLREIDNKFRAAIGENTFAQLSNGARYSLKTQERKEYTVPAKSFRVLRSLKGDEQ